MQRPLVHRSRFLAPLLALSFAAAASAAPTELTLTPTVGPVGTSFRAVASGFSRGETVDFLIDGTSAGIDRAEFGLASLVLRMFDDALPGSHAIEAVGLRSGLRVRAVFLVRTDWSQFGLQQTLGRNNVHERLLDKRSVGQLKVAWRGSTSGAVEACPTFHDGIVLAPSRDGILYAFDSSGGLLWKHHGRNGLVTAAAVASFTDPGSLVGFNPQPDPPCRVVLGTQRGVDVVELASGRRQWSASIGAVLVDPLVILGFNPQPDPPQIFLANDAADAFLFDLDGELLWKQSLGAPASGAPSAYGGPDSYGGPNAKIVVPTANGRLVQLDALTGRVDWTVPLSNAPLAAITAVPFSTGLRSTMLLLGDAGGMLHGVLGDGSVRWSLPIGKSIDTAVALGDPTKGEALAYAVSTDGWVHAFADLQSPRVLWKLDLGAQVHASPAIANGLVYLTAADRTLRALDAVDGSILFESSRSSPVLSAPIVCDGSVFVGTENGEIVAFR